MKKFSCNTCNKQLKGQEDIDKHTKANPDHKSFTEKGICDNCGAEARGESLCEQCQLEKDRQDIEAGNKLREKQEAELKARSEMMAKMHKEQLAKFIAEEQEKQKAEVK